MMLKEYASGWVHDEPMIEHKPDEFDLRDIVHVDISTATAAVVHATHPNVQTQTASPQKPDDEAIDDAIDYANINLKVFASPGDLLLEKNNYALPDAAVWPTLDPAHHKRELAKFDGVRFVRTAPYANASPATPGNVSTTVPAAPTAKTSFNPFADAHLTFTGTPFSNGWTVYDYVPPEPEPPKPCYYCGRDDGKHAPACIEVKYGHVSE